MNNDHTQALKEFIFDELRAAGHAGSDEDLDHEMFQASTTLRLRWKGYHTLKSMYDHEEFPLEEKLTGRELMTLKHHVGWPYFVPSNQSTLYLFTMKQSFLLKLQGGDVKRWLAEIYENNSN